MSKQREFDADPRAIQQIEFIGMLKTRSHVFTILEKSKETILEFYKGTAKVKMQKFNSQKVKMVEYTKVKVKLTNLQLSNLKKAVKSNEGATLQIGIKNFNKEDLPHELLLRTRQSTKLRNAINNNLAQSIQSG